MITNNVGVCKHNTVFSKEKKGDFTLFVFQR